MSQAVRISTLLLLLVGAAPAYAHFLFSRITPAAEGGRAAEVYFSEYATAGDPRYIAKLAGGSFFVQTKPGEYQPLAMRAQSDRLRGHLPTQGSLQVAGQLDYGVLRRPAQPVFLLRHYCKAVAGKPDEVNAFTAKGTPIELTAHFEPDRVILTAWLDGKPYPQAKLTTVDADLTNEELTTDAQGRVEFKPAAPSLYCVYFSHVDKTAGEHAGEKYDEIRAFATISFDWPLQSDKPDAEAVALFEGALAARAAWQDFPGFTAKIEGRVEGRPFDGKLSVAADGAVTLTTEEATLAPWVEDQLESLTMHRAASQTPQADRPKPSVRFADTDIDHPLGRLLTFEGGHFASSYRVKDRQILVVNRLIDGQNMTITMIENDTNPEGKFLPRAYVLQYWDEKSGDPVSSETVQDRWQRVGQWDLPAEHTVVGSSKGGLSVRTFKLSDHQLSEPSAK